MKIYKKISLALALYLVGSHKQLDAQGAGYPKQELHPMKIGISSAQEHPSLNSPIIIQYTITNTATIPEYFEVMLGRAQYDLVLVTLTHNGHKVPETLFGRRLHGEMHPDDPKVPGIGSLQIIHIEPGKSLTFKLDLTKLYEITEPGAYLCSLHLSPDSYNKQSEETKPLEIDITQ